LEGSTDAVAVHNEFLASANADYGTGIVKITSMRPVKAGEECSIVTTSSDIAIDHASRNTTTFVSLDSTTVNVASTTDFVNTGVAIDASGDVFRYTGKTATSFTGCVALVGSLGAITGTITQHKFSLSLQAGSQSTVVDAITGETTVDRSSSGDSARLRDWWLDHEMGIIYFNNSYPFFEYNSVKVAYIYGERYLEKAIEEAATKLVASELLMSDDRSVLIPEGSQNIDLGSKAQLFRREAMDIIARYKEVVVFS
jgi:hypothetical protein